MRKLLALLAGGILAVMGEANAQTIPDLPAATLPLSGNELTVLVQGGATVQSSISAFPSAAVPPIPLTLSTAPLTAPSLLDTPGSRTGWYGGLPGQRWQLAIGSSGTPIVTGGPTFSISNYYNVPVTECDGLFYNTSCTSGLLVDVTGSNANAFVTSGITIHAATTSNVFGAGVQALNVVSDGFGAATGAVQGAYIQGRRNTTSAAAVMGAEISSGSYTGANYSCALSYTNVGECDGIWLASRGTLNTHLSSALHVGDGEAYNTSWREGITFNPASVVDTTLMDKSSSTTSISIQGTHTTAIHTDAGAGLVGIGGDLTVGGATTLNSTNTHHVNVNAGTAGQQSAINFQDATAFKWEIGKQGDNSFYIFDDVNGLSALIIGTSGNMLIGETGKIINVVGDIHSNGKLLISPTAPAISAGGCTTGSAQSVSASNGSAAFQITLGGATCGSTIALTMPLASNGWVCDAHNVTNPGTNVVEESVVGTTFLTLANYVRTTGVAGNFTGADVLVVKCLAY